MAKKKQPNRKTKKSADQVVNKDVEPEEQKPLVANIQNCEFNAIKLDASAVDVIRTLALAVRDNSASVLAIAKTLSTDRITIAEPFVSVQKSDEMSAKIHGCVCTGAWRHSDVGYNPASDGTRNIVLK